jgi:hypothetical protein
MAVETECCWVERWAVQLAAVSVAVSAAPTVEGKAVDSAACLAETMVGRWAVPSVDRLAGLQVARSVVSMVVALVATTAAMLDQRRS